MICETDHWWVNHRCDTLYPGHLMLGAKDPNGEALYDLSVAAQSELGPLFLFYAGIRTLTRLAARCHSRHAAE